MICTDTDNNANVLSHCTKNEVFQVFHQARSFHQAFHP